MNWRGQSARLLFLAAILTGCMAFAPVGCQNYTPEQTAATAAAITSVVTTTGAVVTPLVLNLENGQKVKAKKAKVITATPTPKP